MRDVTVTGRVEVSPTTTRPTVGTGFITVPSVRPGKMCTENRRSIIDSKLFHFYFIDIEVRTDWRGRGLPVEVG